MNGRNKFTVIYSFKIIKDKQGAFIDSWKELTKLIYEYEGSYGSRLHKVNEELFIGYAQWPDRDTWYNSGEHLPESATAVSNQMHNCCTDIATLFEMMEVEDLLKQYQFK